MKKKPKLSIFLQSNTNYIGYVLLILEYYRDLSFLQDEHESIQLELEKICNMKDYKQLCFSLLEG